MVRIKIKPNRMVEFERHVVPCSALLLLCVVLGKLSTHRAYPRGYMSEVWSVQVD